MSNKRTELLWDLLANPADRNDTHANNLQQLISDYPQSGVLHALLSFTGDGEGLKQAAAYYSPKVLYKLSKDPDALPVITSGQIVDFSDLPAGRYSDEYVDGTNNMLFTPWEGNDLPEVVPEDDFTAPVDAEITDSNEYNTAEPEAEQTEEAHPEELPVVVEEPTGETEQPVINTLHEDANAPVYQEFTETLNNETEEAVGEEAVPEEEPITEPLIQPDDKEPGVLHSIDDDIYDEIVSIDDINLAAQESFDAQAVDNNKPQEELPVEANTHKDEPAVNDRKLDLNDEADKLILNNIAATDFFVFDRTFSDRKKTENEDAQQPERKPANEIQALEAKNREPENAYRNVSKYNDEKMPYSFMWWLDKTRKEHSGIYQPFVEFKLDTTQSIKSSAGPDELQQQYYENIFHLTSVEELDRSTAEKRVDVEPKRKEDKIIERFIHDVPQIKPQSGDKLGNENKAKKSSEDPQDLVTETLAQIYIDQMLYPKAIATYKKLMLKFPEKSRYFASQIENLEKKTS